MRVLVTGGAGYIGSHLVDRLIVAGHDVAVLDDLSTGRIANLAHCLDDIRFVNGSILDEELVRIEVERVQMVFHLAAAVGVRHIIDRPLHGLFVNTRGTENVLGACYRHWRPVVLASTSEVYGKPLGSPMREDDDRVLGATSVKRWSYSTAKALDEHLGLGYAEQGLPVSIVRYFNSYGPRLDERGYGSVVANMLRQAKAGEPITVHGDGTQSRCFTYVSDTVEGTYLAGFVPAARGQVVNIGTPAETTILALAELIRDRVGSSSPIELVSYDAAYGKGFEDTPRRVPDITRAKDLLDWAPLVGLEEGLDRTIEWWEKTNG